MSRKANSARMARDLERGVPPMTEDEFWAISPGTFRSPSGEILTLAEVKSWCESAMRYSSANSPDRAERIKAWARDDPDYEPLP